MMPMLAINPQPAPTTPGQKQKQMLAGRPPTPTIDAIYDHVAQK